MWAKEKYQNLLVVKHSGTRTFLNFLKVNGKHKQCSGLLEAWVHSNLLGLKTAEQAMAVKSFIRGMQSHKWTPQMLRRNVFIHYHNIYTMKTVS